jgi:soluble lytic murein transglycosylase-like protein
VPKTFAAESAIAAGSILAPRPETVLEREKQAITEFIARRYRIAGEAASLYVSTAYHAGALHSVDPLLVIAVMAIESRYNPVAESVMGAKGLMQVIPKFHLEKLSHHGGEHALLDPEVNILVGTQILREYQRRLGDLEPALQMYAGALDDTSMQYSAKVLAERGRLEYLREKARKAQSA